jgi:uncharacterized protein (TIGR00369 family)
MTTAELRDFLSEEFPQSSVVVEEVADGVARVRQEIMQRHLRPGNTVSGPVLMSVADTATYAVILAEIGRVPLAVTTNLSITFVNKPRADRDVLGEAKLLKLGKRLAVAEVKIYSEGQPALVALATVTYSIPPNSGP